MSYTLIDTHAHLDFHQYDADREQVIARARESNVAGIINIGIDLETSRKSIEIAEAHANIFATVGIHPHDAKDASEEDIETLQELLSHPKVVAIGEVGLDFYRNISPPDVQRRIFRMFLDWSQEFALPLVIHTREAEDAIINILKERSKSGWQGVFHCFPGDQHMAETVMEMGFYVSFTGNITFKNSRALEVARAVPLERTMVETDCPFLTPMPHRGKRNEPAYVNFVAQKLAEVKGLPVEEIARITTQNASALFQFELSDED